MRIAIVVNTSWNIYNFRMGLIKKLIQQNYKVHTIAPVDSFTHFLTEAGCTHHSIKMTRCKTNPFQELWTLIQLWYIYKNNKLDVVLHYTMKPNIYGSIIARLLNINAINNVCGLGTLFLHKNIVSSIGIILCKLTFRIPKKVFFQNIDDLTMFLNKKIVIKKTADLVPGSGINLAKLPITCFKRNKVFTFLLISRLILDKGVVEYIEAARQLKKAGINSQFQILGSKDPTHKRGVKLETINKWIEEGIVKYFGTTCNVYPFIEQADCIVLPSYREGMPRVLLEAAGSSKPIITTNTSGCRQVVEDNINGLLCKVKDANDLANKMIMMVRFDDDVLKKLGTNGRKKIIAEYDENIVIDKYLTTILSLKKKRRVPILHHEY